MIWGAITLVPLFGAFWLVMHIVSACVKKGESWRLVGVLASLTIGGACILTGYFLAYEGFTENSVYEVRTTTYPIWGWVSMVAGGLMGLAGTWTALLQTKEGIEEADLKYESERAMKQQREASRTAMRV